MSHGDDVFCFLGQHRFQRGGILLSTVSRTFRKGYRGPFELSGKRENDPLRGRCFGRELLAHVPFYSQTHMQLWQP